MALPAAMALSGLSQEHFNDNFVKEVYNQAAPLLTSASVPIDCAGASAIPIQSIRVTPDPTRSTRPNNLKHYFQTLDIANAEHENEEGAPKEDGKFQKPTIFIPTYHKWSQWSEESKNKTTMHEKRDILDLVSNIKDQSQFSQNSVLLSNHYYVKNNASQVSRVRGEELPPLEELPCTAAGCGFTEYKYEIAKSDES